MERKIKKPPVGTKQIPGHHGKYFISKDGRVWSAFRGRWLKSHSKKSGDWYMSISLGKVGRKGYKVHRLVAQAFIPNPNNLPEVNHVNGDKTDNRVENLEWCSRRENLEHGYLVTPKCQRKTRRGSDHYFSKLTEAKVVEIKALCGSESVKEIARNYGVSQNTIRDVLNGISWNHVT